MSNALPAQARGDRPRFFDDPAVDALLAMVLELAKEGWVTRHRLATLEHWAANAVTGASEPWSEAYRLPDDVEARLAAERDAGVARLLGVVERF